MALFGFFSPMIYSQGIIKSDRAWAADMSCPARPARPAIVIIMPSALEIGVSELTRRIRDMKKARMYVRAANKCSHNCLPSVLWAAKYEEFFFYFLENLIIFFPIISYTN